MSEMPENPMAENGDVTDDDKLWAGLSLALPIIALIAMLMEDKRARPFIKYAAVQSLIVAAVSLVLAIIPVVNCVTGFISLGLFIYMIYLGFQAYGGSWVVIPFVTDFAKGQGWI